MEIWGWNCTCQLSPWINCIWLAQQVFIALREHKQNFARLNYPSSSCDASYPKHSSKKTLLYPSLFLKALMILHLIDACCHGIHPFCLQRVQYWWVNSFPSRCGCISHKICKQYKVNLKTPQVWSCSTWKSLCCVSGSGCTKGQNLQQSGSYCPKRCLPSSGWDGDPAPCRWWQFRQRKTK